MSARLLHPLIENGLHKGSEEFTGGHAYLPVQRAAGESQNFRSHRA